MSENRVLKITAMLQGVDKISAVFRRVGTGATSLSEKLQDAKKGVRELEKQNELIEAFKKTKKALADNVAELKKARDAQRALKAEIAQTPDASARQRAALEKANEAVQNLERRQGGLTEKTKRLNEAMRSQGFEASKLKAQQAALQGKIEQGTAALKKQTEAYKKHEEQQRRIKNIQDQLNRSAATGAKIAAAGVASGYVARQTMRGVGAPVGDFAAHEDAMLGIARQVEGARDESGNLTQVYRDVEAQAQGLSKTLPMTTVDIVNMMTAAARMEVPTDKLADFTRVAANMATAFDAVPDEITTAMGQVAKNFKMPITEIGGLADAINYLDDNAISKGGDIIDYLNRTSGILSTVKMSAQDAAALGSTLLTLGERTDTASTASNAIINKFVTATKGTKNFHAAIDALGLSAQAIQDGMSTDAMTTMLKIFERIQKLPKKHRAGVMYELVGGEHNDTLAKLADKSDELKRQIKIANSDKAKGSMDREAAARASTLSAKWIMANNQLFNAKAAVGESLKPALLDLMTTLTPLVAKFTAWVKENPKLVAWIGKAVIAFALLSAGLSALLMTIGVYMAKFALMRFLFQSSILSMGGWLEKLGVLGYKVGYKLGWLYGWGMRIVGVFWRIGVGFLSLVGRIIMAMMKLPIAMPFLVLTLH